MLITLPKLFSILSICFKVRNCLLPLVMASKLQDLWDCEAPKVLGDERIEFFYKVIILGFGVLKIDVLTPSSLFNPAFVKGLVQSS